MTKPKASKNPSPDLAEAFLDSQLMEETRRYAEAGRRFQAFETGDIHERWIVAFKALFFGGDQGGRADMDDLAAELRLRDLLPPYDQVKPEVAILQARIKQIGPDAPNPKLDEDIDRFFEDQRKPKS